MEEIARISAKNSNETSHLSFSDPTDAPGYNHSTLTLFQSLRYKEVVFNDHIVFIGKLANQQNSKLALTATQSPTAQGLPYTEIAVTKDKA